MSDPWKGLLDTDEEILWQGAPDPKLRIAFGSPFALLFHIFWTGFAIFWCSMAALGGGYFWMFGLIFVIVGLFNLIGVHFWKTYLHRHTYYTLTSKRAFIGTNILGHRSLSSYPIRPDQHLEIVERDGVADVNFDEKVIRSSEGNTTQPIGFERIRDARTVLSLMRRIQEQAT